MHVTMLKREQNAVRNYGCGVGNGLQLFRQCCAILLAGLSYELCCFMYRHLWHWILEKWNTM